jgi:hypothetical protein
VKGSSSDPKRKEALSRIYATLGGVNIQEVVKLPEGEDLNEWLALNSKSQLLKMIYSNNFIIKRLISSMRYL